MYAFSYNPAAKLLVAELEGFWTVDTVRSYSSDLFALLRRLGIARAFFRMLAASDGMPVQSQEVGAAFTRFTADLVETCHGPIAITAASVLNKLQASRALAHPRIRVFTDAEEARAWLLSVPEPR